MFESTNYTHEKKGAGNNFQSANSKYESIPKPPYPSGIVTYEDDQTAIFRSTFAKIFFRSAIFFKKLVMINYHLVVFIQNDHGELQGL